MSAPSPEPRAWVVGASYWGARESVPYMLRDEAEPLYDAAALAAARRQALEDAAQALEAEHKLRHQWDNHMLVAARLVRALNEGEANE